MQHLARGVHHACARPALVQFEDTLASLVMDMLALPHAETLCIKLRLPTAVGGLGIPAPSLSCEA
eukprot:8395690-Prorocentrum_lima.AAC.1